MNFSSGTLVLIKDITIDTTVRIVGKYFIFIKNRLIEYDLSEQYLVLEHQKSKINVDTTYLGDFKHIIGNYYSVLGHVVDGFILKARLIRNVQGLDISVYETVLEKRIKFLKKI